MMEIKCGGRFWRSGTYSSGDESVTCGECEQRVRVVAEGAGMPTHWLTVTIHGIQQQSP
jgi:hypothetical protein